MSRLRLGTSKTGLKVVAEQGEATVFDPDGWGEIVIRSSDDKAFQPAKISFNVEAHSITSTRQLRDKNPFEEQHTGQLVAVKVDTHPRIGAKVELIDVAQTHPVARIDESQITLRFKKSPDDGTVLYNVLSDTYE